MYLKKLEYHQILDKLSTYCHTYIGKKYCLDLMPSNHAPTVKKNLTKTEQAVALIERNGTPPISEIEDISVYIKMLESSQTLSAKALLDISTILEMNYELKTYFKDFKNDLSFDHLYEYFDKLYYNSSISNIIDKIKKSILDANTIADSASKNLNIIRRNQRRCEQDIKNKLNSIIHSST